MKPRLCRSRRPETSRPRRPKPQRAPVWNGGHSSPPTPVPWAPIGSLLCLMNLTLPKQPVPHRPAGNYHSVDFLPIIYYISIQIGVQGCRWGTTLLLHICKLMTGWDCCFKSIFPSAAPCAAYPFFPSKCVQNEIVWLNTIDDDLGLGCVGYSESSLKVSEPGFISSLGLQEWKWTFWLWI